ncbi:SecY-interacting protein Syd [Nocardiopsis sp. NPDC049922]|uniref:SecY-interacting protein Syd n=1 Tax=Nocardiopsis sp. NPDC049922 TaxID=3155157 RepID=UPI0033DE031E
MSGSDVKAVLGELLAAWCRNGYNLVEFDPERPSPCCMDAPGAEGMIRWSPVEMNRPKALTTAEVTLTRHGLSLHPDAVALYGSFWSGPVESEHSGQGVLLNTVWNETELEATAESIVGGVRLQAMSPGAITVPIAGTGSDLFFTLDNTTGEILLQEAGCPPARIIAPSLASFLGEL